MWNFSTCDCKCNQDCKFDEYLDIKNCSCEKRPFDKVACQDEILNTTEILLEDKIVIREKNNCFNHTILLVNVCLLFLVFVSISCY